MPSPTVELKNVKEFRAMSRETICFHASVYINGVNAGTVENDGHGGCNSYNIHEAHFKQLTEAAKAKNYDCDFEIEDRLIGDLLNEIAVTKVVKKHLKEGMVFEALDGTYAATRKVTDQQRLNAIKNTQCALNKLGGKRFIPDLPSAVALYLRTQKG